MAIGFTGHCSYPIQEAQRRIAFLRKSRPEWFGGMMNLTDASDLGPFGHEIALEFGIDAACNFGLFLLNKDWLESTRPAVEYLYEVFGTDHLVVTYGMDSIRPPLRSYSAMQID